MNNEYSEYILPLGIVTVLLLVALLYLVLKYQKESKAKDEKIKSLGYMNTQNEQHQEEKIQAANKKIVELTHTVNRLERNASEGSKSQVVTKIEAQQNRRARELKRTGLEEG